MEKSKEHYLNIVIVGASSAMAKEVARAYCKSESRYFLVGRNNKTLDPIRADLLARGASDVLTKPLAVDDYEGHIDLANESLKLLGKVDLLLIAHGALPNQSDIENDFKKVEELLSINYTSYISYLTAFSSIFEKQGSGTMAVFTSVAGDRGRKSNYVYGSFKAGVQTFLEGLRARMSRVGVSVLDIRPGFVDTPMTASIEKGFLFVGPEKVAEDIVKAVRKKKSVLYTPFFWKYIMLIIKSIPKKIFNKLNF